MFFLQIVVALVIFNVWMLRFDKPTNWRGGSAKNMIEEFGVYGLPVWSMLLVGFLKLLFATMLIVGLWERSYVMSAAFGLAILMFGAVLMHIKVKDPLKKTLPAFCMLCFCIFLTVGI